jgi:hypothetical protein
VPVFPAVTGPQVPALPGTLQESQAPVHAVSQHTPSTHWPLAHWLPAEQAMLLVCFGTHMPPLQKLPAAHCASAVHALGHAAEPPPHTYGAHEGLPVLPAATGLQVPALPGTSQESHAPVHAVSQHTPSTHWPLAHCFSPPHAVPGVFFFSQVPAALQKWPSAHWASEVHLSGQDVAVPSHVYGEQEGVPVLPGGTGEQLPALPGRLQASHAPSQAVLQHTPSTQWLLAHCSARVHVSPAPSLGTQARPSQ